MLRDLCITVKRVVISFLNFIYECVCHIKSSFPSKPPFPILNYPFRDKYRLDTIMLSNLLTSFFKFLNTYAIPYCVLRNYERLPEYTSNDIDLLISSKHMGETVHILKKLAKEEGFEMHTCNEFSCLAMTFHSKVPNVAQIHIDMCTDVLWKGFALCNPDVVLSTRKPFKSFYIACPEYEQIINLLTRLVYHGYVKGAYREDIHKTALHPKNGPAFLKVLEGSLGKREGHRVWEAARKANWVAIEKRTQYIRKALILQNLTRDTWGLIRRQVCQIGRFVRRLRHSAGVSVAIIGPDGAGKSSLIDGLRSALHPTFSDKQYVVHWRPSFFRHKRKPLQGPVIDPHGKSIRNRSLSHLFLAYHTLLFMLGYVCNLFPRKFRGWILWLDRYYYDFFTDSRRFRLSLSMFWVDLGYALVPKPDIVLLLDAPPGVLRTRKQEVSFEEATRQCDAYRELVEVLPNGVMIKADQPLEDVMNDALHIILDYLVRRTNRQWKRR